MKSMIKDACILFAITLIAGIMLGAVYQITKEPIEYQETLAIAKACSEVFDEAYEYDQLQEFANGSKVYIENFPGQQIDDCMEAVSEDGETLGYVITVTTKEGYGGDIRFLMGVQNDGTLNGISILEISETAGLGMQAGDVLVPQFADKKATSFVYTKTGAASDNEIDAISGATVTTNAVVNGVNAGLYYFFNMIER